MVSPGFGRGRGKMSRKSQDPPSLLFNGYQSFFPGTKQPESEADRSSPSGVKVK
jgi:hypothetical protein